MPGDSHVDDEVGEARVLRGVRIGARDDHAPSRRSARRWSRSSGRSAIQSSPSLTALVRRPARSRAGDGLAEELAPDLLAARPASGSYFVFCSGVPWVMIVGPTCRWPIAKTFGGVSKLRLFLADQITALDRRRAAAAVLLRPGEAGPAAVELLALCQAFASRTVASSKVSALRKPPRSVVGPRRSAFASSQARAFGAEGGLFGRVVEVHRRSSLSATAAASRGVERSRSSRSTSSLASRPRACRASREQLRAAVEEVAVVLPGVADAAVELDHLLRRELEGVARGDAGDARGDGQLVGARSPSAQAP